MFNKTTLIISSCVLLLAQAFFIPKTEKAQGTIEFGDTVDSVLGTKEVFGELKVLNEIHRNGEEWVYGLVVCTDGERVYIEVDEESELSTGDSIHAQLGDQVKLGGNPSTTRLMYQVLELTVVHKKQQRKASTSGSLKALSVHVSFTDGTPDCDTSCIQQNMFGGTYNVASMYSASSYGALQIPDDGASIPSLQFSTSKLDTRYNCNSDNIALDVNTYLDSAAGGSWGTSSYDLIIYHVGWADDCGIGLGEVGGVHSWVNSAEPDTIAHEVGHNLGMRHSGWDSNNDLDTTDSGESAYGDYSGIMGISHFGLRGYNAIHRIIMDWVPSAAIHTLDPTLSCLHTVSLAALTNTPDNTFGYTAVQTPRNAGGVYTISYRGAEGHDSFLGSTWGSMVYVHTHSGQHTYGLAKLLTSESYTHSASNLEVRVVSISAQTAVVEIDVCHGGVDHCASSPCEHTCTASSEGFTCSCDESYYLAQDSSSCTLIITNECETNNGGCSDICTDTELGYECSCTSPHFLGPDGLTCWDENQCLSNNGGCDQTCTDLMVGWECSCFDGYTMEASCVDTNECEVENGGCDQICTNTVGSYVCSCEDTYQLSPDDQKTCALGVCDGVTFSHSVLMVAVSLTDISPFCDAACLEANANTNPQNVVSMYEQSSYGNLCFETTIVSVSVPKASTDYAAYNDYTNMKNDFAAQILSDHGLNVNTYDIVHYHTGFNGGFTTSTSGQSVIKTTAADIASFTIGYGLGFPLNLLDQDDDQVNEGYDYSGSGSFRYSSTLVGVVGSTRITQGWIPSSAVATPTTDTQCQHTIQISALTNFPDLVHGYSAVQFSRSLAGKYTLEYRSDAGYDASLDFSYRNKVHVRTESSGGAYAFFVTALGVSESFENLNTNVKVTVDAISDDSAQVTINLCAAQTNDCATNNGGCTDFCMQTTSGHTCSCPETSVLNADAHTCDLLVVNSCESGNGGCEGTCTFGAGSYTCSCPTGQVLSADGHSCDDIDECATNVDGCEQLCTNTDGSYTCSCHSGYDLNSDGHTCVDIDECATNQGGCSQTCTNTDGGYTCSCGAGYLLNLDAHTCDNYNECEANEDGCSQTCTDTDGGYICSCGPAYQLNPDAHTCDDIDECATNQGGCDQTCTNTDGGYTCSCGAGYQLNPDLHTCDNIDECATNEDGCSQTCTDTDGGYTCSCEAGYQLNPNGHTCDDIDECATNQHTCDQVCTNNVGSFSCGCHEGYELLSDMSCQVEALGECGSKQIFGFAASFLKNAGVASSSMNSSEPCQANFI